MVKKILIAIVALLLLLVLVSFMLPSSVHVERSTEIAAAPEQVFPMVNTLKNWEQWSAWHEMEPTATYTYSDPGSGAGAHYSWSGEKLGKGKLEITKSVPNSSIATIMSFEGQGGAEGDWKFEPTDGGTKVTWGFDTELGNNPISRFFGLMMDSMVGPDFEKGLANMKAACESAAEEPAIDEEPAGESTELEPAQ